MIKKPNGYGSVYKIKSKKRNPWIAVVTKYTVLKLDDKEIYDVSNLSTEELLKCRAVQKRKILGYYPTRLDAEKALAKYNVDPEEVIQGYTFSEVYHAWKKQAFDNLSQASIYNYESSFKSFRGLHNKKMADLKTYSLESYITECAVSDNRKQHMKVLLNQMYKYALKYDIVPVNYAESFSVSVPQAKIERVPFSDEEIAKVWADSEEIWESRCVLVMLYTGVRIKELYTMDADTSVCVLKGGLKTISGKNRTIPIREKIKPLIPVFKGLSYKTWYEHIHAYLKPMNHTPHDCRVTFASRYKNADPTALKLILGHSINDVTKGIYTKYTNEELREFIESVDY